MGENNWKIYRWTVIKVSKFISSVNGIRAQEHLSVTVVIVLVTIYLVPSESGTHLITEGGGNLTIETGRTIEKKNTLSTLIPSCRVSTKKMLVRGDLLQSAVDWSLLELSLGWPPFLDWSQIFIAAPCVWHLQLRLVFRESGKTNLVDFYADLPRLNSYWPYNIN